MKTNLFLIISILYMLSGCTDTDDFSPEETVNESTELADLDGDGVADDADAFPADSSESLDSDGDGIGDNSDVFPMDPTEYLDSDGDGVGDNTDAFPDNGLETHDSDQDGYGDNSDMFPNDASEYVDSDGDGVGDNSDVFPNDASKSEEQRVTLNLPDEYFNYANITLPEHYTSNGFPANAQFQRAAIDFDNTPLDNPTTDAGATLGRVLFYDKKLSANGTVACASCHQQEHGFADPEVFSIGFDGGLTGRHSMGLANARFYFTGKFFWDERAETLEDQALMPFQDPVEMGLTLLELEQIVEAQEYYPPLFEAAFGDPSVNSDRIAKALAQFQRSIVSTASKYDIARSEVDSPFLDFPGFTAQENLGKDLFYLPRQLDSGGSANCAGCHVSEAFVGPIPNVPIITTTATVNGLDAESIDDLGIFESTGNNNDIGKFKAPSLVNIGARPPYMHDGRFATLEDVIDHYSTGIQNHQNLIAPLRGSDGLPIKFNFTQEEKTALVAFLNTLTDHQMLADEKYSDPFEVTE